MMPSRLLSLFVLLLQTPLLCAGDKAPAAANYLLGCWQQTGDGPSTLMRFEPSRCLCYATGALQAVGVKYQPGKIVFSNCGQTLTWNVEVKDDQMVLTSLDGKTKLAYRKLKSVPAELELRPVPLGKASLSAEKIAQIQKELAQRRQTDQGVRQGPLEARAPGMAKVDGDNTAYIIKLIAEVGWIDVPRFGKEAAVTAYLIVQHSGHVPLMVAALPAIEKDAKAKHLEMFRFALLYDRLHVLLAEKQRYGSQFGQNDKGEWILMPLENKARVEEYRKEAGLLPLKDYLEEFKKKYSLKEVKMADGE